MIKTKTFCSIIIIMICILGLSFYLWFDQDKNKCSQKSKIIDKVWRIGYLEGGSYKDYQSSLIAIVYGLMEIGCIEKINIPTQKNNYDTYELWKWLCDNIKSDYIEFVPDAYYSNNWDSEIREETKIILIKRLNEQKDIDMMLTFGTWAGQDLSNNKHSTPTVICSVSDPVTSKIIKDINDSGYDHIHARVSPNRYERQIRTFHKIIGFKKLGIVFENTVAGKSYAAIEDIEEVAKERNFEIVNCYTEVDIPDMDEKERGVIDCINKIVPKIDAFYISTGISTTNSDTFSKIMKILNNNKIPTFTQDSSVVKNGALMSISFINFELTGKFHAEVICKIISGVKPRELNQIFENPIILTFNKKTAEIIDLNKKQYELLINISDKIYDDFEER